MGDTKSGSGSCAEIPLRDRRGGLRAVALVDEADAPWLSEWRWCLTSNGYVVRKDRDTGKFVLLHRQIMEFPPVVDHRNGDRLDNRRANLRSCARGQLDNGQNRVGLNANNRSGYRGVTWYPRYGKWRAQAQIERCGHTIGYFDTPEEAAAAAAVYRARHMAFA